MSYRTTNLPSHLRHASLSRTSTSASTSSSAQSSALQARINEKRAELENLKQLRDLSAGLAGQMEQLEEKLNTLSDGTQGMQLLIVYIYIYIRRLHHCMRMHARRMLTLDMFV